MAIGESRHGHECRLRVDGVDLLDAVADGEDRRVACALMRVHRDPSCRAHGQSGADRERELWSHAARLDDEIRCHGRAVAELDRTAAPGHDGRSRAHVDATRTQHVEHGSGHLGIQGGEHVLAALHEGDSCPACDEVLHRLETDEPGADHDDIRRPVGAVEHPGDLVDILDTPQMVGRDLRSERRRRSRCPRGEYERVVGFVEGEPRVEIGHVHDARARVDPGDLVPDAHVEGESRSERGRGLEQEGCPIGDDSPDVVRQPAVREGDVMASFEHHDLPRLVEPPESCRRGHSPRDSTDDECSRSCVHIRTIPRGV